MTYKGLIKMITDIKNKGAYQKDIAEKSKVSQHRLSLILKGKAEPTKKELENFANYFNCGLDDLVEIEKTRGV